MGRCTAALWGLAVAAGAAGAQTVALPPLGVPAPCETLPLPAGTDVSRPLQPVVETAILSETVVVESPEVSPGTVAAACDLADRTPLGRSWSIYEYVLWWPKSDPLPPLATAARGGALPVLGGPATGVLIGGRPIDASALSGGRFTWGWAVNGDETAGLEVTYFFTGTSASSAAASGGGPNGPNRTLGRPVVNPFTGAEDVVLVARPGGLVGGVTAVSSIRTTGWEVTGVANLHAAPGVRVNALAGYRYFLVNEGLRVEQTGWDLAAPRGTASADQIDAHNGFHGGQLGLHADITRGSVFVEMTGKVGFGQTVEVVEVSGQSVSLRPGVPLPVVQTFQTGVLGQPSNSGKFTRSAFAVLPEASLKVGYRFKDRSRLYLGYNFLYLSDVVRPGDQVDRSADPAGGVADRPAPLFAETDFWLQGLLFGLEFRY